MSAAYERFTSQEVANPNFGELLWQRAGEVRQQNDVQLTATFVQDVFSHSVELFNSGKIEKLRDWKVNWLMIVDGDENFLTLTIQHPQRKDQFELFALPIDVLHSNSQPTTKEKTQPFLSSLLPTRFENITNRDLREKVQEVKKTREETKPLTDAFGSIVTQVQSILDSTTPLTRIRDASLYEKHKPAYQKIIDHMLTIQKMFFKRAQIIRENNIFYIPLPSNQDASKQEALAISINPEGISFSIANNYHNEEEDTSRKTQRPYFTISKNGDRIVFRNDVGKSSERYAGADLPQHLDIYQIFSDLLPSSRSGVE